MTRKRFLVTGGCGFIGSHLVEQLLLLGHDVKVLDNLSTGLIENVPPGIEVVKADVSDADAMRAAMQGMNGCFHLAAIASVVRSNNSPMMANETNLRGAINVFHCAAAEGGVPVVYASSAAVYGANSQVPLSELTETRPLSVYGADKLSAEIHAQVVTHLYELPTVSLRFFNVYGPRQDASSPYSGVISVFADCLWSGRPLTVHGDGLQQRDFVYVSDVVEVLIAAMTNRRPEAVVCNVCTGVGTSIRQLAAVIAALMRKRPSYEFAPARPGDIRVSTGDPTRVGQLYGLARPTVLQEGLARLLKSRFDIERHVETPVAWGGLGG